MWHQFNIHIVAISRDEAKDSKILKEQDNLSHTLLEDKDLKNNGQHRKSAMINLAEKICAFGIFAYAFGYMSSGMVKFLGD